MPPIVDFYVKALKNYAKFEGRAGVGEYWWFVLANIIVGLIIGMVFSPLRLIYNLAVLVPSIAVGARRLHDTGKSGWWLLLALTIIGVIPLIYFLVQPGNEKGNKYN